MNSEYFKIKPRRSTATQWRLTNPTLERGELAIEYPDSGVGTGYVKIKLGDGETSWNDLPYAISNNEATSIIAGNPDSANLISVRCGSSTEWSSTDPVLRLGEPGYDKTNQILKVGDGIHKFSELRTIGKSWEPEIVNDYGDFDDPEGHEHGALKPKRGTQETLEEINPVLAEGEMVIALPDDGSTGPGVIKIGDGVTHWNDLPVFISQEYDKYIPLTQKGAANGVVPLNVNTKIDSTYLPSYVDDILEFDHFEDFPNPGEAGKIYVDKSKTKNNIYRWSGTQYILVAETILYTLTQDSTNLYKMTFADSAGESNVIEIPHSLATTSANGLMSSTDKSKLDGISNNAKNVAFSRSLTTGTKIGTITIDGTATDLYCQTNSNTTYTLGTNGNTVTLTPSSGTVQSITVPYATSANSATSATSATKATQDESANNIKASYAHSLVLSNYTLQLKNMNGAVLGTGITLPDATTSAKGLMSSTDKTKLDGIAAGATKVTITNNLTTTTTGTALDAAQGKALNDKFSSYVPTTRTINSKALSSNITLSASDVGLGNVGNFKAVSTVASQGLTSTEQSNARANIGAGTGNGTITGITMNGSSKGTSGVVNLGTVLTSLVNNLTTTTTGSALDATQGKALNDKFSSYVPTTRTINSKALSSNITLSASDIGLGNVGNFKAVSTVASQGLTTTEQSNARTNIGAAASTHTHNYAGSSSAGGAATTAIGAATVDLATASLKNIKASTTDLGTGQSLAKGTIYLVYE